MSSVRIALVGLAAIVAAVLWGGTAVAGSGQDVLHEVQAGDNLHLIAGYYYGDARQWERIWQGNRELIDDPNRIERGLWVRIPDAEIPAEPYADFLARMGVTPGKPVGSTAPPAAAAAAPPDAPALQEAEVTAGEAAIQPKATTTAGSLSPAGRP